MKNRIPALLKSLALSAVAFTILALGQSTVRADEVFIAGYTNGCFNNNVAGGCVAGDPPNSSATQTASLFGLQYVNSTFSGTTANGFRALGGNPIAPPTQNFNNLGAFSLSTTPASYTGNTFELRVTFTAPQGINGSNTTLFSATLVGTVTGNPDDGGVFIDFNNTPILFTFNDTTCTGPNTCGVGSFTLTVNDVAIDPGQIASITGQITAAQQQRAPIPEPATLFLLGTGLSGVAAGARRRRQAAKK